VQVVEPSADFFVSKPTRATYSVPRRLRAAVRPPAEAGDKWKKRQSGGVGILIFQDEQNRDRRRKSDSGSGDNSGDAPRSRKRRTAPTEVGDALRTVYQRAIDEDIPPEMLDLLGKLG
jgi:hypothetical protein